MNSHYSFIFIIACFSINLTNGQWFKSIYHSTAISHIIGRLKGVTITSCQLYCSRDTTCYSIAIPNAPHMGAVGDCYLLKEGWDGSNGSNGDTQMLHVLDVKLTPIGCRSQQITIRNAACDPPPAPALPSNLALGKSVSASSVQRGTKKESLVDGNVNVPFIGQEYDDPSWVQIDLGQIATITKILCYSTQDDVHIVGSTILIGSSTSRMSDSGTVQAGPKVGRDGVSYYEVVCSKPVDGQFVKVEFYDDTNEERFSASEIEVWGVFKT